MVSFTWDFSQGAQNWQGGFTDYPIDNAEIFELETDWRSLPPEIGNTSALFITGSNRSDDLFMYFRNRVEGLAPNTAYQANFAIQFASNAPTGSFGIGGSPADSVYLKAGATAIEPLPIFADPTSDFVTLNVDKGNQSQVGRDAVSLGTIAKPDDGTENYVLVDRASQEPFRFTTDATGSAWFYFGTDSGFEGTTSLYYTQFRAELTPAASVSEPTSAIALLMAIALVGRYLTRIKS